MPELTLDHPKRILHLGGDTCFDFFNPISQGVSSFGFIQRFALAQLHGYFPVQPSLLVLNILELFNVQVVNRVGKDHLFLPMQLGLHLRHILCISRRCRDYVRQALMVTSRYYGIRIKKNHRSKLSLIVLFFWPSYKYYENFLFK
jgi:hypothetical protein